MGKGKVKNKTHKATKKRFKISGTGKLRHNKQRDNAHLKINKTNRRLRRQEGKTQLASDNEEKKLKRLILK